jgi:hypothetical protein
MSVFKRPSKAPNIPRASDGFATLTGDMMARRGATPPPLIDPPTDTLLTESAADEQKPLFGKRRATKNVSERTVPRHLSKELKGVTDPQRGPHPCQITEQSNQKVYTGPDRRKRDVSPVVERRSAVPPRVKVSVRLEQYRHQRLKGAGVLLGRTHQDIITVALDKYLDALGVLKGEGR